MQKEKIAKTIWKVLLPALALLFIAAFLLFCRSRFRTEFPYMIPEDGVLDAREVDFAADVYELSNRWEDYPGVLYGPEDFKNPAADLHKNEDPQSVTIGTYRLRILARPNTYLSLCSFSVDYSTRIFVDGREVRNIGFVADNPAETIHRVTYLTLPLYVGEMGEVEIIYQHANFMHRDGGYVPRSLLSTPENIDAYERGVTLYSLLLSAGLLFLCFYFLLCASFQKNPEYAALAFCCFILAFRNQFFFLVHLLPPESDFLLTYRRIILDVSLIPAAAICLLLAFFRKAVGKWLPRVFLGTFLVLSAAHFVVDTKALVDICHICYYICAPFILWIILRLVWYFRREKAPDRMDALAIVAALFFMVMLIREGLLTGSDATVNHFGITPLSMVISILLLAVVINGRIWRQRQMLREAEQRNEMLRQVNDMNKEFLRTVAHELKTPLTVISGYAQLMERQMSRSQLSAKTPERLQTIHSEAERLGAMVTTLMDYTYGNASEAEMTAVDVAELLKSAEAVLTPVCGKRQNRLYVTNACRSSIHGNFELLLQVLINLIVNASRYTEGGKITVEATEMEEAAAFAVRDTGQGIPPEAVPHIFERGYTTGDGRGLGLAICQETVRIHGGVLELVSTGPEGTTFRFTVPKE